MNRIRKKINFKNILLYLFVLSVIGLFAFIYLLPNMSDAFKQTIIIQYGGIQLKNKVTCYIVRDETVYLSDTQGELQYFIEEGEQVRKGTKIIETIDNKKSYNAQKRGMVSYYFDGLENYFKPETMISLKYKETKEMKIEVNYIKKEKTEIGEPIYKIINSDIWYAVYWIDKEEIINYEKDKKVKLVLPKANIQGLVSEIIQKDDSYFIILKFDRYYEGLSELRKIETSVITSDFNGLTLPNECITTIDEKPGVYVKNVSGEFYFTPIKILTSDGINSLVECTYYYENTPEGQKRIDTVDIYDEVLKKI